MDRMSPRSTGWMLAAVAALFVATVLAPRAWWSVAIEPSGRAAGAGQGTGLAEGNVPSRALAKAKAEGKGRLAAVGDMALPPASVSPASISPAPASPVVRFASRVRTVALPVTSPRTVAVVRGALADSRDNLGGLPLPTRPLIMDGLEVGPAAAELPPGVADVLPVERGMECAVHDAVEVSERVAVRGAQDPLQVTAESAAAAGARLASQPTLQRVEAGESAAPLLPAELALPVGRRTAGDEFRGRVWPVPESLLASLEAGLLANAETGLLTSPETGPLTNPETAAAGTEWTQRTRLAIERLVRLQTLTGPEVEQVLADLERLAAEYEGPATAGVGPTDRQWLATRHALRRRLDVWRAVHAAVNQPQPPRARQDQLDRELRERLAAVERGLTPLDPGLEWRRYLLLDEIGRAISAAGTRVDARQRCDLALKLLARLESPLVTRGQQRFLNTVEIRNLADSVRHWAVRPIDYHDLMRLQEMVEAGEGGAASESLARYQRLLQASDREPLREVGRQLEEHYRNANVRVVLSSQLIQRFLPTDLTERQRINDQVLGVPVVGRGTARTELRVDLVPDPQRWRVDVSARGQLTSSTRSTVGPATFFNRGYSRYELEKQVELNRLGLRLEPAAGSAETWSRLARLETDLDWLPLLGLLVRSTAQSRYEEQMPATRRQLRRQVASEAASRLDREFQQRLEESEQRFRHRVLEPLDRLDLNPLPIELQTTETRLIGRFRLAATGQLAADRPRPREPQDSWLALQLHASTLNNALARLGLEDKRRDLPTLFRELAMAAGYPDAELPADLRDEQATIEFADRDPIRVEFEQERIGITLRLAELKAEGRRAWRNLIVRAHYQPLVEDGLPRLERDGYIQLDGERLRLRDQIALRGIFSKMFPRHPDINDISAALSQLPQLRGTQVSQFVARDGWLAVAVSPPAETKLVELSSRDNASTERSVPARKD